MVITITLLSMTVFKLVLQFVVAVDSLPSMTVFILVLKCVIASSCVCMFEVVPFTYCNSAALMKLVSAVFV